MPPDFGGLATNQIRLRPTTGDDHPLVLSFIQEHWGSVGVVSKERILLPAELPGFLVLQDKKVVGLATYRIVDKECEVVTLNSLVEGSGIGSSLLSAVRNASLNAHCKRMWLVTTNDNLSALRFYQRWGLHIVAAYPNALELSRKLKPEIPMVGKDGIPLRDEIELEMILG